MSDSLYLQITAKIIGADQWIDSLKGYTDYLQEHSDSRKFDDNVKAQSQQSEHNNEEQILIMKPKFRYEEDENEDVEKVSY